MSAQKSGMSRNTARKHLRQDDVLRQEKPLHTWRTRKDPLERIWPEALKMLREAPELEAKALFDHLSQCHPGEVKPGLLRTFERRVRKLVYSVPSRLIGTKLLARIYENRIVLFAGAQEVAQLPLGTGDSGAVIDFRHLIGHLVRKPGAFAGYRWREELFPAPAYRAAFDHLERRHPAKADRLYLEILKVAAGEGETVVENALEQLLGAPRPEVSAAAVSEMLETWRDQEREWRGRPPMKVDLGSYDDLLESGRAGSAEQNETTLNAEVTV